MCLATHDAPFEPGASNVLFVRVCRVDGGKTGCWNLGGPFSTLRGNAPQGAATSRLIESQQPGQQTQHQTMAHWPKVVTVLSAATIGFYAWSSVGSQSFAQEGFQVSNQLHKMQHVSLICFP